ncbi:MAG: hypothetical protein WCO94_12680 [Verrucomicrobiota bacterium]
MKYLTLFIFFTLINITFSAENGGIIVSVDYDQAHGNEKAKIYEIPSGNSLNVAIDDFQWNIPAKLKDKQPNSMQFIVADTGMFACAYSGQRSLTLNHENLLDNKGLKSFVGFNTGQRLVLAIGYMENKNFYPYWAGMIDVKPKSSAQQGDAAGTAAKADSALPTSKPAAR